MKRIDRKQVLLLKMTPGEQAEALALARGNPKRIHTMGPRDGPTRAANRDVLLIRGSRVKDEVKIGSHRYDLSSTVGRRAMISSLKIAGHKAKALATLLARSPNDSRDELAQLIRVLNWSEKGKLNVQRLVLSGHYTPSGIEGDEGRNGRLDFSLVAATFNQFPIAAKKVEHLMLASCYGTLKKRGLPSGGSVLASYRSFLPNLASVSVYGEKAPASRSEAAARDLKRWERNSRRTVPSRQDVFGTCQDSTYAQRRRAAAQVVSAQKTESCSDTP